MLESDAQQAILNLREVGKLKLSHFGRASNSSSRIYLCPYLQLEDLGGNLGRYSCAVQNEFRDTILVNVGAFASPDIVPDEERYALVYFVVEYDEIEDSHLRHMLESIDRLASQFDLIEE